jgi:hypothetical protein
MMRRTSFVCVWVAVAVGCGGATRAGTSDGGGDAGVAAPDGATTADGATAPDVGSPADGASPSDGAPHGGNCSGPAGANHRAQAGTCASNAGIDAGCNIQPKDQCLTDSDCGSTGDCECETPILAGQPCPGGEPLPAGNICLPSNCRTDADCAACGVCQGDFSCGQFTGFYCRTPSDACVPTGPDVSYDGNGCRFVGGHWVQTGTVSCPG